MHWVLHSTNIPDYNAKHPFSTSDKFSNVCPVLVQDDVRNLERLVTKLMETIPIQFLEVQII